MSETAAATVAFRSALVAEQAELHAAETQSCRFDSSSRSFLVLSAPSFALLVLPLSALLSLPCRVSQAFLCLQPCMVRVTSAESDFSPAELQFIPVGVPPEWR